VQVQGMIAEYKRAKIMERSRRGMLHHARAGFGQPAGAAPYGFVYVKKSDQAGSSYRVLLHEAKVVRDIFHSFVVEQSRSVPSRASSTRSAFRRGVAHWGRPTVWTILRNPAHMGKPPSERPRPPPSRCCCVRVAAAVRCQVTPRPRGDVPRPRQHPTSRRASPQTVPAPRH
jgi:site-specific DNA recombinase